MEGKKNGKKAEVRGQKSEVGAPKAATAVAVVTHRNAKFALPVKEMSPEARVDLIRTSLDKMEGVQLQFASGAIFIGMELMALKDELGHGEFQRIFEERIARPRFSYRTGAQYMRAAERVRTKLLRSGAVDLGDLWDVAPSALPMKRRKELSEAVGELVNGRSLSQLLLDLDGARRLGAGAMVKTGPEAEKQARIEIWQELCRKISQEVLHRKSWVHLDEKELEAARTCLRTALNELMKI